MKYMVFFVSLFLGTQFLNGSPESDSDRAPRLDAPPVTSPISVVVPSLDLGAVLQTLASINCKIGNVNQDVCEDTILSVLGDACSILGISISEALAILLDCCLSGTDDLIDVFTVLQDIKNTITECCSTMTTDFQNTWTILAELEANFCNPTFIYQSDFDPSGATPYVINSPGVYKFAEDITYNPAGGGTSAITINSSDVILDLQCFTLQQGNAVATTNGITVNASMTNFVIKNGHIESFTDIGVLVSTGCSEFELSDFVCMGIQMEAIALSGPVAPTTPTITQGTLKNLQVLQSSTLLNDLSSGTVLIEGCADLVISNCQFNNNTNSILLSPFKVLFINNCVRCYFEDLQINNNTLTEAFNGILIQNVLFSTFTNIDLINNRTNGVAGSSTFTGINITTSSSNNEFYNCRILGHQFPGNVTGMAIGAGCTDMLLSECEVSNNSTTGTAVAIRGFSVIVGSRNTVKNCIARNNTAPNSTVALFNFGAYGYDLSGDNNLFQNNLAEDQDTGVASNSVGFRIFGGTNNTIDSCQSYRQDFGYRLEPLNSTSNVFTRNIAAKNTTNYSQFPVGSNQNAADISAINGSLTVPWTNIGVN